MKSLHARLVVSFSALLLAVLITFGTIVWLLAREAMSSDVDEFLRDKAMLLSRTTIPMRPRIEPWIEQELQVHEREFVVQVFNADGTFAGKSSNFSAQLPLTEDARRSGHPAGGVVLETMDADGRAYRVATHPRRDRWGEPVVMYSQAALPLDSLAARENRLLTWLIVCGAAMLASGAAVSWFLGRLWLRSVGSLEEAARTLSTGNLSKRRLFAPSSDAELAALAAAFNSLLDRLESSHTMQQRFTADASHELRTPLTVLRGEIEVALRKPRSAEEYREVLVSNKEEIERLSRLTENMLALAHADTGDAIAQRERFDVAEPCEAVVEQLQPLACEKGLIIELVRPKGGSTEISGDRIAIERVLQNLVENAIRYASNGEHVGVRVSRLGTLVQVEVSDNGTGISSEHLPHLFDRFYRVDKGRSRAHGGCGLGLSIVKVLVEAHGGGVSVSSVVGQGSVFTVRLPAAGELS